MTDPNTTASDDLVPELDDDLILQVADIIRDHVKDEDHGTVRLRGIIDAARAVLSLLQPRLDAADALVRTAERFRDATSKHMSLPPGHHIYGTPLSSHHHPLWAEMAVAIEDAKAAGLGGGE